MVIKYKKGKITDDELKFKFLVYGKRSKTTVMLQTYEGKSDEELLSVIMKYWDVVEEYEMLPAIENAPELTRRRLRDSFGGMIGGVYPPLPVTAAARSREMRFVRAKSFLFRFSSLLLLLRRRWILPITETDASP